MTKKLLVPYSDKAGPAKGRVFVAPVHDGSGGVTYVTMPGGKPVEKAMVAFVGSEISVEKFMVRMVDSGFKIMPSYDWQSEIVSKFLAALKTVKVGAVVRPIASEGQDIQLDVIGTAANDTKPKLP